MSTPVNRFIPRHAAAVSGELAGIPQPLARWREIDAYVLLGEPGAGKTGAFASEEKLAGGKYVKANDFLTLNVNRFKGISPIYIDGLDEIRAGSNSFGGALDRIKHRLDELGCPQFRLSCREADWHGAVDQDSLRIVAPKGEIAVLQLVDLDDAEIVELLEGHGTPDPRAFIAKAKQIGIDTLLGNPLLLRLTVEAVGRHPDNWPQSRTEIYRNACEQLLTEHSEKHLAERRGHLPSIERLMGEAGSMCALHLLSGIAGYAQEADKVSESVVRIDALPDVLDIPDAREVYASKLFAGDAGVRQPIHRTIAEFLAARSIARRITDGLPVNRMLSLMCGVDGGVVDSLRGLFAWLATLCKESREILIDRDPLGVVLYGDLGEFSSSEKQRVFHALRREALRYPWFRKGDWRSQPFGALGTPDMAAYFCFIIQSADRSAAHQSLLECVLESIKHGKPIPEIAAVLQAVVRDRSYFPRIRDAALDALLAQTGVSPLELRRLLNDIEAGVVPDEEDELSGRLLAHLYPATIAPEEIFRYFRQPKAESLYGSYRGFWSRRMILATPIESLGVLMEVWVSHPKPTPGRHIGSMSDEISATLLAAALAAQGDNASIETLYRWVGAALDEHESLRFPESDIQEARSWLSARPQIQKKLIAYGWTQLRPSGDSGKRYFWRVDGRTLEANRPRDWYLWLLEQAAATDDVELA
ncbi:MAG: hypothetical protein ACKVQK_24865, partial [Burkholderiales bacterium]